MLTDNEIIFVSGQRGGGKSYWTKKHSLSLPRCVIYDSLGEYQADQRFYNIDEYVDFLIEDEKDQNLFRVAFDSVNEGDISMFCRASLARGNMYIIIEEIDLYCKPLVTDPDLKRLIKYGRHYGIQLIGVSRKPSEVSRDFTSNATRFITFVNREPLVVKYFRSMFGDHALKIPNLEKYHYLDVNFSEGEPTYDIRTPIGRRHCSDAEPGAGTTDAEKEVENNPTKTILEEGTQDDIGGEGEIDSTDW